MGMLAATESSRTTLSSCGWSVSLTSRACDAASTSPSPPNQAPALSSSARPMASGRANAMADTLPLTATLTSEANRPRMTHRITTRAMDWRRLWACCW